MSMIAKVTSKGQTTLPAPLRAKLGVGPGDHLRYDELPDGRMVVSKADTSFESLRGIIKVGRRVGDEELEGWIEDARSAIGGWDDRN